MELGITRYIHLINNRVILNGILELALKEQSVGLFLRSVYRHYGISYPKFYKMDNLCKLGFLSAEILLKGTDIIRKYPEEAIGVILGNASSSLDTDEKHQQSIHDRGNYFPSPSIFVYTLANIMAGEIAIRHKIKGENAVFIWERFDPKFMVQVVSELFHNQRVSCCLSGWVECYGDCYESIMVVVEQKITKKRLGKEEKRFVFDPVNLGELFKGNVLI
jgi:hypothetical protein